MNTSTILLTDAGYFSLTCPMLSTASNVRQYLYKSADVPLYHWRSPSPDVAFHSLAAPWALPSFCEGVTMQRVEKVKHSYPEGPNRLTVGTAHSSPSPRSPLPSEPCPASHICHAVNVFNNSMHTTRKTSWVDLYLTGHG